MEIDDSGRFTSREKLSSSRSASCSPRHGLHLGQAFGSGTRAGAFVLRDDLRLDLAVLVSKRQLGWRLDGKKDVR